MRPVESLETVFDYRIQGGDENMRPIRVVDDGKKTFIQMTPNAAHREASGPCCARYRWPGDGELPVKGDMYIVDRLFERGPLFSVWARKPRRAEIIRGTYRGKVSSKEDPYRRRWRRRRDETHDRDGEKRSSPRPDWICILSRLPLSG